MQKIKPKTIYNWFYEGINGSQIKGGIKDKAGTGYSYKNMPNCIDDS